MKQPRDRSQGFTLIEVVIVLAVLAAVIGLMAPNLFGLVEADRERETQEKAEEIFRAIFGNPAQGEFGYLGDMGRLPTSLSELVEQGNQLAFHTADGGIEHVGKLGTGWRGPYLKSFFSTADLFLDSWGRPFDFQNGQIISLGPDGVSGTTDDIVFPLHAPPTTGRLFVSVLGNQIPGPLGATAKLYSPLDGEQAVTPTRKHLPGGLRFDGFVFENVTHGLHALVVAHTGQGGGGGGPCSTVARTVIVPVHAGQSVLKEVRMLTGAVVSVTANPCAIPD
ncbi:MAG: prepilin-type N-terminal cleavage/methylation domain-containing protein [Candidatus Methylomirabilia bacterium]